MRPALFLFFIVLISTVSAVELPVPASFGEIEFIGATSGGDFALGAAGTELIYTGGNFYAIYKRYLLPIDGAYPEDSQWQYISGISPIMSERYHWGCSGSFFYWDVMNYPHFIVYSYTSYYDINTMTSSYSSDVNCVPEYAYLNSYYESNDGYVTNWSRTNANFYHTIRGDYVVLANTETLTHSYPYPPGLPVPHTTYSLRVRSSNGFNKTYDGNLTGTVPRYNTANDTFTVLGFGGAGGTRIDSYLFGDQVTTYTLVASPAAKTDLEYQPDPAGRMHMIWKEDNSRWMYSVVESNVASISLILMETSPSTYPLTLKLYYNNQGDLLLFNVMMDGTPVIWRKSHEATVWNQEIPPGVVDGIPDSWDAQVNSSGGFSLLAYQHDSPPKAWLWRCGQFDDPIVPETIYSPDWSEINLHAFTQEGGVGLLVTRNSGRYSVFVLGPYQFPTAARTEWTIYR